MQRPFKLVAPYQPTGDQPTAIERIVENAQQGYRNQVLLGATGTGKSVAWDEPVTIRLADGTYYRGPIGRIIDTHLGEAAQEAESVELPAPSGWQVIAWDPSGKKPTTWKEISAISRHRSPRNLWELRTGCGRSVQVTEDHSVWVLRNGKLQLVKGSEVCLGDSLPIPLAVPEPERPLTDIDFLDVLDHRDSVGVKIGDPFGSSWPLKVALSPFYPHPLQKANLARKEQEGVTLEAARTLVACNLLEPSELQVRGKRYLLQNRIPVTEELAFLLGQYIAEGHGEQTYCVLTVHDPEVRKEVARSLTACGIPYFHRRNGMDYVVSTRAWYSLITRILGTHAHNKNLPTFWPSLSNTMLGSLLRGYFEGDGTIDKGGVTAVTLNSDLASEICEALLRFGIWGRFRTVNKKKPNGEYGTYTLITVSGQENVRLFARHIGFVSSRKQAALLRYARKANTNTDLVFGVGSLLRNERLGRKLLQREIATAAGCTRSMISAIEMGTRDPSRALFSRICRALGSEDRELIGLAEMHWSPVVSATAVPARHPYVYDFSVPEYETFMTGKGGLIVHNTFVMANAIERLQRPALVMAHNKTLAAQLFAEFREFFPHNSVQYFVSYYDYYQPEAYIPLTDTYIEKDSNINEEIEKFRHASTHAILTRSDVIIVASVSCIYGLGSPEVYRQANITLRRGEQLPRLQLTRKLTDIQYQRNDVELTRGRFRIQGDTLTIFPAYEDYQVRIVQFGDEIESLAAVDPLTGKVLEQLEEVEVFPAKHYLTEDAARLPILERIEADMRQEVASFEAQGKLLEAQRLKQRVSFDLEMIRETGTCSGIENYSRYFDQRPPGSPPSVLLDYFPKDYLLFIDESHITVSQVSGMYNGDQARKQTLVDYGFRLKAAKDNRPLTFQEFEQRMGQTVYVSATPGAYELERVKQEAQEARLRSGHTPQLIAEQLVRPTGIIDPEIEVRPTDGQIDDLLGEIRSRVAVGQRILVTTLTKRMAEDITEFLQDRGVRVQYLHSDIKTIERSQILQELRQGTHDVVVGINLLREGLDLPEVSLVAILDADKEGFLRSETSLVQTIGRAARHLEGKVIMYANRLTGSMERAIHETNRRREIQQAYNREHGLTPTALNKPITVALPSHEEETVAEEKAAYGRLSAADKQFYLEELRDQMQQAVLHLDFERAAELRDKIRDLQA